LFILNNGDRFFLLHYGGQSAVGLYALGYKFGTLISMFVMAPFLQVWGAMMIPLAQKENAGEIYARVFTYMMFLYLWVGLGLSVFSPEAVRLATDPKFHSAHQIIPLVVLAYLFWSTTNLGDTPFYVKNRTAVKPFLLGAAAVVNLALYRWLIPAYGGWGAAWATLASFAFFAVLTRIVAQKIMPIPYDNRRFLTMLFVAGLLYAASRAVSGSMLGLAGKVGLCLVFPLALYALGFFDLRERQKLQELYQQYVLRRQTGEPRVEDHPVERAD